jgi:neurotransmitter:Na+ symporter, NSS family
VKQTEQWSSKIGFILAAAGSAIGLGAIWKFPYVAGVSGGGVFFVIFLFFTLLVGLPLLLAEFSIGRSTQKDAIQSYKILAPKTKWYYLGYLGMATSFILLSYYSVIGGWIIIYLVNTLTGQLNGLSTNGFADLFNTTISNPSISIGTHFIFMFCTIFIVAKGVQKGIEKASKFMMPLLFILFIILVVRSLTLPGAMEGVEFLFFPDITKMTSETILAALGQSFFLISVGVSVMVTYSSYVPKTTSLPKSALSIVIMNVFVVILAGLAIFPAVFSFGMKPDAGPVLLFQVLPNVFSQMPIGMFFFFAFLVLFLFAALTSALSMLELIVSVVTKGDISKRNKWSWIIGLAIFAFGIPSALSYGPWGDFTIFGRIIFDAADYLVSNILLPIGALLIAIFVPLKMNKSKLYEELCLGGVMPKTVFHIWFFLVKYIAPVAIILVLLDILGVWDKIF